MIAARMFSRNGFERWPLMYSRMRRLGAASALKSFQRLSDSVWCARAFLPISDCITGEPSAKTWSSALRSKPLSARGRRRCG